MSQYLRPLARRRRFQIADPDRPARWRVVPRLFVSFVMATGVRKSWQSLPRFSDWIIEADEGKRSGHQFCMTKEYGAARTYR
jgi:hypothetical protein